MTEPSQEAVQQTHSDEPHVIVIGAGISGLVAAFELQELAKAWGKSLKITLVESRSRIGGAFWTDQVDGFLCEGGADSFITNKPWALELCHRLGLSEELMGTDEQNRRSFVLHKGRLLPVPDGFVLMAPNRVWPVLRTPILSLKAKLRLMLEPFIPKASADSDESLASFVRRRLGNEVLQRLVQPLVGGIYTADPESLSLRSTMPQFIEMEQKHGSLLRASLFGKSRGSSQVDKQSSGARYGLFATLRTGMGRLTQSLRDHLPKDAIHLETAVREIVPAVNQSGWQVHLSNGSQIRADGVVIATETHHAAEMVRHFDGKLASELLTIPYASSAIALVGFDRSQIRHPLNGFGLVVPACENRKILAISFTSVKLPDRAPKGKVLLRVFVGGAMQPELYSLSDEEIKKIVIEETSELLGITGGPCLYQLARHHRSMPQYTLGHQQRVERIREGFKTHQGLVFASNALAGVGVPDCVRTAQLAAKELFGQLF